MNAALAGLLPTTTGSRHENATALTGIGEGDGGVNRDEEAVDGLARATGVTLVAEAVCEPFGSGLGDDPQPIARNTRTSADAVLTVT